MDQVDGLDRLLQLELEHQKAEACNETHLRVPALGQEVLLQVEVVEAEGVHSLLETCPPQPVPVVD